MMIFLTLLFTAVSWASPSAPDEGWKKVDETDGVTTSIRDVKGSPFIGVKGEGVIDAPISVVASVVDDMPRYKDWVDHLESSRWLHRDSPWNYVEWDKFKMPFPLQDRDFVTRAKVEVRLHPLEVIARVESVDDPLAEPEYKHYIRGEVIESYYIAREIDATHTFLI
ncbi:MAG: START domain-containing protein, partial [Bdellovibrionota bacterium]